MMNQSNKPVVADSQLASDNQIPHSVKIVEVGPRDGLQNEKQLIDVDTKIELINRLVDAGLKTIESGSFVNPQWVPQMAGSEDIFKRLEPRQSVTYTALTPNLKGYQRAQDVGVKEVAVFAAASESFSQKNINCSISESIERFKPLMELAKQDNIPVRGYISCVLGCPYDGDIGVNKVNEVAQQLIDIGCYEISLGDTIGVGTPAKVKHLLATIMQNIAIEKIAVHFHDTYGQALANIYAALQMGISVVDSSIAGLGGCPYAKGASGNVATEDVVYMLNGLGISTGTDLDKLITAGNFITTKLGRTSASKVAQALS